MAYCVWRNIFWFMLGVRYVCAFRDIQGYSRYIVKCWILKDNFILALPFQHLTNFKLTKPWLFSFICSHIYFLCYSVFQSLCSLVSMTQFKFGNDQTGIEFIWNSPRPSLSLTLFFSFYFFSFWQEKGTGHHQEGQGDSLPDDMWKHRSSVSEVGI